MSYPGNASLAQDVKDRISNTFQQTLDLVVQGKDEEARAGCEFILRMDPAFAPAQTLVTRLSSPQRPVVIGDLKNAQAAAAPTTPSASVPPVTAPSAPVAPASPLAMPTSPPLAAPPPAASAPSLDDLDDLGSLDDLGDLDDLDDLGDLDDFDEAGPSSAAPAAPASGLATVIEDLLQKRNFSQVLQIAESQKDEVARDPRVQALVETAGSRLESDAYVKAFVQSARQAQAAGQLDEMRAHLAKARTLDPEHPDVLGFDQQPAAGFAEAASAIPPSAPPAAVAPAPAASSPTPPAPEADENPFAAPPGQELELADDTPDLPELSFDPGPPDPGAAFGPADEAAADFGGLDAEPEPAPTPPAPTAAPSGGADGGGRIAQLLQEGQEIFERQDYQAAIDVWSRIFLIDIDNGEASRRIEEARSKKAELERRAEELFHEASDQIEQGELDAAKETLRQVLESQPNHTMANEYLEQLEAGQVPAVKRSSDHEPAGDFEALDPDALIAGTDSGPSMEAAVQRDRIVVVKRTDKRLIALGALVSVLVIAGAYTLYSKWDDFFPNQKTPAPVVQVDMIERATQMHEAGNTENAIILLGRIQPQDPIYNDAQALLEQWKAHVEANEEPVEDAGPSEEQTRRFNLLIQAAREAHGEQRFIRARKYIERARKFFPLDSETQQLARACDEALESLAEEIQQFEDGEYSRVIPKLWRKREEAPENPDIRLLLINSYYNLALTDLQRGDALGAAKKLQEALEVEPENVELERMQLFAQTYVDRPQDLLYRIYVKYLPSRS